MRAAEELCYPSRSSLTNITESSADIKLQDLLDHICKHLLLTQRQVMKLLNSETVIKADLICKWRCDRSAGQSEYKQKFSDEDDSNANIFFTSLCNLNLLEVYLTRKLILFGKIWDLCLFALSAYQVTVSSNTKSAINKIKLIEQQITKLVPLEIVVDSTKITVNYQVLFTMIDGKICNAITSTTFTFKCYLCGATSVFDFCNGRNKWSFCLICIIRCTD